jgi:hypothetical protein
MRVLGVSDIHGNVRAVERLRELERNEFDLVVLARDIGDDNADAVIGLLSTFGFPQPGSPRVAPSEPAGRGSGGAAAPKSRG